MQHSEKEAVRQVSGLQINQSETRKGLLANHKLSRAGLWVKPAQSTSKHFVVAENLKWKDKIKKENTEFCFLSWQPGRDRGEITLRAALLESHKRYGS